MATRTSFRLSSTQRQAGTSTTTSATTDERAIRADFFYDSLISHFSLLVCLQQFLLQLTFPLLVPIFYWKYGSFFLTTHRFLIDDYVSLQAYLLQGILIYLVVSNWKKNGRDNVVYHAMLMPLFFMIIHRIMISVKYACLSPSEYRRIMRGKTLENLYTYPTKEDRELGVLYQNKLQLISNFHSYSSASLWLEVYAASKTIPVDLSAISISVTTSNPTLQGSKVAEMLRWEQLLRSFYPHEPMTNMIIPVGEGNYRISAKLVMGALYGKLQSPIPLSVTARLSLGLGILFASIPLLNLEKSFTAYEFTTQFQIILVFLFSIFYFTVVVVFGGVSIADQIRRVQFALYLGEMIHFADSTLKLDFRITNAKETS